MKEAAKKWLSEMPYDGVKIMELFAGLMISAMLLLGFLDHFGIIELVEKPKSTVTYFYGYGDSKPK